MRPHKNDTSIKQYIDSMDNYIHATFDGTIVPAHMPSIRYFVLVVIQHPHNQRFVCVHEKEQRGWWLPSSSVNERQLFSDVAIRDVYKKTGISIVLTGILRVEHSSERMRIIYHARAIDPTKSLKSVPDKESQGARWINVSELMQIASGNDPLRAGTSWLHGPEPLDWFRYLTQGEVPSPMSILQLERLGDAPLHNDYPDYKPSVMAYRTIRWVRIIVQNAQNSRKFLAELNEYGIPCLPGGMVLINDEHFWDAAQRYCPLDIHGVVQIEHQFNGKQDAVLRITFVAVAQQSEMAMRIPHSPTNLRWLTIDQFPQEEKEGLLSPVYRTHQMLQAVLDEQVSPLSVLVPDELATPGDMLAAVGRSEEFVQQQQRAMYKEANPTPVRLINENDWHTLRPGDAISVRGRDAIVENIDLPLLHWRFVGDYAVYHRSLKDDGKMFAIPLKKYQSPFHVGSQIIVSHEGQSRRGVINGPTKDGYVPILFEDEKDVISYEPEEDIHPFDPSTSHETFPEPADILQGLMVAYESHPKKEIFENLGNFHHLPIHVKFPDSVHFENCTESKITLLHKVSAVTLINCEGIQLHFSSVISSFDVIRSKNCEFHCRNVCRSYLLEDCKRISILFPETHEKKPVLFIANKCDDITLSAMSKPPPYDNVSSFTINLDDKKEEIEEDGGDSSELKIIYQRSKFVTKVLDRQNIGLHHD